MALSNKERIGRVLDAVRDGLGPYIIREYRNVYKPGRYVDEIRSVVVSGQRPDLPVDAWTDEAALIYDLDAADCLKLMAYKWNEVFQDKLGRSGSSFAHELQTARNEHAHAKDAYTSSRCESSPCVDNGGSTRIATTQRAETMLRDAYQIDKFFIGIQELTSEMDAQLARIDGLLDDDELYQMVRQDLEQRYPLTRSSGRPSTPVEVILRMLVVKHLYGLSYEKTEQYVKDSLVLRRFCRVYLEAVPDHSTLNKWALTIKPETLQVLNARVVKLATELRVTSGRKLRTDGTVVETNIHYPTDSSLLVDSVRVLSRTLKRAQQVLGGVSGLPNETFRDRTRSARRAARQGRQATRQTYGRLLDTTRASIRQAQTVLEALKEEASEQTDRLRQTLETFIPRTQQVIGQTVRRVFEGEKVPAQDKLVSIFEPHSDIIKRGKAHKETEFGHKVWLDEVEGGIISGYRVLEGNPSDQDQWQPSLDHHVQLFGKPPWLASADRGVWLPDNEQYATDLGVKRVILPQRGDKSDDRKRYEKQAWFRRGRRWHAGVEGRISVTKRKHCLDRCLNQGDDGFQRCVGWGVIANNLTLMGRKLAQV